MIGPDYFTASFKKQYPVTGGSTTLTQTNHWVIALLVGKHMQDLALAPTSDSGSQLADKWIERQKQLLTEFEKGEYPIIKDPRVGEAWNGFLNDWMEKVVAAGLDKMQTRSKRRHLKSSTPMCELWRNNLKALSQAVETLGR